MISSSSKPWAASESYTIATWVERRQQIPTIVLSRPTRERLTCIIAINTKCQRDTRGRGNGLFHLQGATTRARERVQLCDEHSVRFDELAQISTLIPAYKSSCRPHTLDVDGYSSHVECSCRSTWSRTQ